MIYRLLFITIILLGVFTSTSRNNFEAAGKTFNDSLLKQDNKTVENLKKGKVLYEKNCIMCHGNAGKGDGIAGMYLNPRPFDISSDKVQVQSDSTLFYKITVGKAPMPSFKTLPFESRQMLVMYVRELGKTKMK